MNILFKLDKFMPLAGNESVSIKFELAGGCDMLEKL
jgi:hypothetical protein